MYSNTPEDRGIDVKSTSDWLDETYFLSLPPELRNFVREAPINLSAEDVYESWRNAISQGLPTHYVLRALERHVVDILNESRNIWPGGRPPLLFMPRNELWKHK